MFRTTSMLRSSCVKRLARSMSSGPKKQMSREEYQTKMNDAVEKMESYHEAANLLRQGKLPNRNAHRGPKSSLKAQFAIAGIFIIVFAATPYFGKKIAQDHEFRAKYIPAWYDFTIEKPKDVWTRERLHEHFIAMQRELRERAIKGDFTTDKLQQMQKELDMLELTEEEKEMLRVESKWDQMHPGLEEGESLNESD